MGKKTRLVMIGGFLGAGKTTMIGRLAQHYIRQGLQVAVVTNDQAFNLVDTQTLRSQGLEVGEVPGACFCCKFDSLVETASSLGANQQPDIILTEPVGSCTDLVATVIEPLRHLYGDRYEVGKLAVLCKPEHGAKILANAKTGFSPKAAYIFLKQLEEADIVVVNKIDKLPPGEADQLAALIQERFPTKEVLLASGKTGRGFHPLVESLAGERPATGEVIDMDYDIYAEGEAELAWLNASVEVTSAADEFFVLDELVLGLVRHLAGELQEADYEAAHLKVLGFANSETSIANLVSADAAPELSLASGASASEATLIVNARVAGDPNSLAAMVQDSLVRQGKAKGLAWRVTSSQHFRPGRPVPTHRYA